MVLTQSPVPMVLLAVTLLTISMMAGCVPDSAIQEPGPSKVEKPEEGPVKESGDTSKAASPAIPLTTSPAVAGGNPAQVNAGDSEITSADPIDGANRFDGGQNQPPADPTIEIPERWKRLSKEEEIWIDMRDKQVIIGGTVCLNQGPLEMFICPAGTKEHESVMAARVLAQQVHSALIALGSNPGKTASWNPEYRPAFGPLIEIEMRWRDPETGTEKSISARQWIRNTTTGKAMQANWVFGGSEIYEDIDTGQRMYLGESGELVCLSNFSTATIDLNVKSSQDNYDLLFEAFTENIPPIGTQVYALIRPGKVIGLPDAPPPKEGDTTDLPQSTGPDATDTPSLEPPNGADKSNGGGDQ